MIFCAEEELCLILNVYSSTQRGRTDATVKSCEVLEKDIVIIFGGGILTIVILHNIFSLKLQ